MFKFNFEYAIAAPAATSAFTIEFAKFNFEYDIDAELEMSAFVIEPSSITPPLMFENTQLSFAGFLIITWLAFTPVVFNLILSPAVPSPTIIPSVSTEPGTHSKFAPL